MHMHRWMVGMALFGGLSCGAMAQGTGEVQLYGIIDLGVAHYTGLRPGGTPAPGQTVSSTGLSSGVQSLSRIGIRGREALGDGTSAMFDVETGFCAAGLNQSASDPNYCTGGGFMQRLSLVGLQGRYGRVIAGRAYTSLFMGEIHADPFEAGFTADSGNISLVPQYGLFRFSQMVGYTTPSIDGLRGHLNYSFAPASGGTVPVSGGHVERGYEAGAVYAHGALSGGVDYLRMSNRYADPSSGVVDGALELWQVRAGYNFGVARVTALYEVARQDHSSGKDQYDLLGVTVPMGGGDMMASVGRTWSDLEAGSWNGSALQLGIGYSYALSKTFDVYASYAHIDNSGGAHFAVASATDAFSGVAGQASSGVAIGVRKSF